VSGALKGERTDAQNAGRTQGVGEGIMMSRGIRGHTRLRLASSAVNKREAGVLATTLL
jgi:hypothetical protein